MQYSIGKVVNYNDVKGTIVTNNDNYLFLKEDIDNDSNNDIQNGDLVEFRPEEKNGIKKAYFVKKLPYSLYNNKVYFKQPSNNSKDNV